MGDNSIFGWRAVEAMYNLFKNGGGSVNVESTYSTPNLGVKTVTTAQAPEQLVATSTPASVIVIQANEDNVGTIAFGFDNTIRASGTSKKGNTLQAGDAWPIPVNDLSKIWIDASIAGEGVTYSYYTNEV